MAWPPRPVSPWLLERRRHHGSTGTLALSPLYHPAIAITSTFAIDGRILKRDGSRRIARALSRSSPHRTGWPGRASRAGQPLRRRGQCGDLAHRARQRLCDNVRQWTNRRLRATRTRTGRMVTGTATRSSDGTRCRTRLWCTIRSATSPDRRQFRQRHRHRLRPRRSGLSLHLRLTLPADREQPAGSRRHRVPAPITAGAWATAYRGRCRRAPGREIGRRLIRYREKLHLLQFQTIR